MCLYARTRFKHSWDFINLCERASVRTFVCMCKVRGLQFSFYNLICNNQQQQQQQLNRCIDRSAHSAKRYDNDKVMITLCIMIARHSCAFFRLPFFSSAVPLRSCFTLFEICTVHIYSEDACSFIPRSAFRPRYHRISIKSLLMRLRSFRVMYTRARAYKQFVYVSSLQWLFIYFCSFHFISISQLLLGCTGAHKHMHTHIGSVIINKLTCVEMPDRAAPRVCMHTILWLLWR